MFNIFLILLWKILMQNLINMNEEFKKAKKALINFYLKIKKGMSEKVRKRININKRI